MQKEMPVVIENIFSMVWSVYQGRIDMLFLKHIYQTNQKIIRVADRIVIGIDQVVFVFHFRINGHVRQEESLLCRIALFIIKMRTVSVENYKLPGSSLMKSYVSASLPKKSINEWL